MPGSQLSAPAPVTNAAGFDDEFALDVRVVEGSEPDGGPPPATSDNCGSTCAGTACTTSAGYPA